MAFVLGLAQCCHPEEGGTEAVWKWPNSGALKHLFAKLDILVFPESLMTRYEQDKRSFASEAEPIDGPFCCSMDALRALWALACVRREQAKR